MSEDNKKQKKPARLDLAEDDIQSIVNKICEKYGRNTLALASQADGLKTRFTSTGVAELDIALGGGIPNNRMVEFRGGYSCLKTTLALFTLGNWLRDNPTGLGLVADIEKSWDSAYAKRCGVDTSRVMICNPDSGEQAVDIMNEVFGARCGLFALLDSLAAMVPRAELDADAAQALMAAQARLVGRFFRLATARTNRDMYDSNAPTTTVWVNNQIREKPGVMFGSPEYSPGGKAKDFAYSVIVRLYSSASSSDFDVVKKHDLEKKVRIAQGVKFRIEKNKVASSQWEEGEFVYYVKNHDDKKAFTFNNEEALFKHGVFNDIIIVEEVKKGKEVKPYFAYEGIGSFSRAHFQKGLRENPDIARQLYLALIEKLSLAPSDDLEDEQEETADIIEPSKPKKTLRIKLKN